VLTDDVAKQLGAQVGEALLEHYVDVAQSCEVPGSALQNWTNQASAPRADEQTFAGRACVPAGGDFVLAASLPVDGLRNMVRWPVTEARRSTGRWRS
jgi:hypothetical protein